MSDYTPSGKRRRYDPSFKAMIIELCRDPKNSVAKIAQAHELNPNLVHKVSNGMDSSSPNPHLRAKMTNE